MYSFFKFLKEKVGVGFAVIGKTKTGEKVMYDRYETNHPGAGQSLLHSKTYTLKVSTALRDSTKLLGDILKISF